MILGACAFASAGNAAEGGDGRELAIDVTAVEGPLGGGVFPVIFGRLGETALWLGGTETPLPERARAERPPEPPSPSRPAPGEAAGGATARFPLSREVARGCAESRRVKELLFLVRSMADEIAHVVVRTSDEGCGEWLRRELAATGIEVRREPATSDDEVRVAFASRAAGASVAQEAPAPVEEPPEPAPTPPKLAPRLYVDGREITLHDGGWFVVERTGVATASLEVRVEGRSVLALDVGPTLLVVGANPGARPAGIAVTTLKAGAPAAAIRVRDLTPERRELLFLSLSLPIYLKTGLGYTLMTPLPDEQVRDRSTILIGVRTHPLLWGLHVAGEGFVSIKAGSRLPYTVLAMGFLGGDLAHVGKHFSIPWGVGARYFRSEVRPAGDDEAERAKEALVVPKSVLGPAAVLGLRHKSRLVLTELQLVFAPLKVEDSPIMLTWNPSLALGYALTAVDSLTLVAQTHDVRYPLENGEARIRASTVALGYQRDLE